jgi:uncharacterized membrane protein
MRTKPAVALSAGIVAAMFAASFALGPRLPETMATHWNAAGVADGTMPKFWGQVTVPAVTAGVVALTFLAPKLDPKRENIEAFRGVYNDFVVVFTAFLALVHGVALAINLGYDVPINAVIYAGVGLLFVYLGTVLRTARQNWVIGIRTPWTLSDERVWERTHAVGGRLFVASGLLALLGAFTGPYAVYLVVGPVLVSSLALVAYSYYLYERDESSEGGARTG